MLPDPPATITFLYLPCAKRQAIKARGLGNAYGEVELAARVKESRVFSGALKSPLETQDDHFTSFDALHPAWHHCCRVGLQAVAFLSGTLASQAQNGGRGPLTLPALGEPAPPFTAPTPSNPKFHFSSVAGRYVVLGFLPADAGARGEALAALKAYRACLDDAHASCFLIARDPDSIAHAVDSQGLRWFLDAEGAVSRLYGALADDGAERPMWIVLDPSLRVLFFGHLDQTDGVFRRLQSLPPVNDHAGTTLHAPVLIVPRIFEPDLCRRLIDHYEAVGGHVSGVMREVNGKTVGVVDDFKKRRDANIDDEVFKRELMVRIARRLAPEIEKSFQFKATRIERYIVARYDAEEGGYFRPHRDNTTAGTAHRRFAVSINLNAGEFEGGDLRFPEFGMRTYRPPTGGAVVFSCSLLHEATPVTRGKRYAFLPFLFDEAGARVRQENLHLLQVDTAARADNSAHEPVQEEQASGGATAQPTHA